MLERRLSTWSAPVVLGAELVCKLSRLDQHAVGQIQTMKQARDWTSLVPILDIDIVRQIQADALRWAGNISGPLHRLKVLQRAQLLERLAEGSHDQADHDAEQKI